ncbi:LacI family DNA-binding transcriptional regulator [Octadecabacter sp. G9-8]|uniref:LacI family DNA-binding transcriptional regulator n=1 Tax=Octadecabacter dasysiphoniae TaxID=2909341 RepID=A0ABS9CXA0_9RHOB|nr:LacI family DNA-binding transcriptional regulator [Octadecabacter dasysiphoniae]MCF2871895.1 LacI family DNA-binding transcriptional regulator [Octadecabacter dasysiphoniae]
MPQKVTSLQVAQRAGVSQSAVSRVFTKGASASPATVEKVKKAAAELGYRPNVLARAMITGKSRIIGLVVAYLDNQFYPEALERLSNALQAEGYHVLLFTIPNSSEGVEGVVQDLMDYQVDGIIAASVSISSGLAELCHGAGIPVVLFNRGQPDSGLSSVTSANIKGGHTATQALIDAGHTRIAHIAGWGGSLTGRDRKQGFEDAMENAGLTPFAIIDGMFKRDIAAASARQMMQGQTRPDAIFVGNDHMAFAVMDTVRTMGFSIPGDVSIIGYDDVPLAAWAAYDLTTMRQPVNRMVEATVDTMLAQINGRDTYSQTIEIEGPLIQRGSSLPPKGQRQ